MLSDPGKSEAFRKSKHWQSPLLNFQLRVKQDSINSGQPAYRSNSFSGNERNRLLFAAGDVGSDGSIEFIDRSLVSGADCREDARSFATLDYDGDGWLDIALASANAPRFRLFRNRMGDLQQQGARMKTPLLVKLEGANASTSASTASNRDASGALLTAVTEKGLRKVYRRSIGEGLSSQNSAWIRITVAPDDSLQRIEVRWPSGRVSEQVVEEGGNRRLKIKEPMVR